jgi:hypothetical protein
VAEELLRDCPLVIVELVGSDPPHRIGAEDRAAAEGQQLHERQEVRRAGHQPGPERLEAGRPRERPGREPQQLQAIVAGLVGRGQPAGLARVELKAVETERSADAIGDEL